MEEKLGLLFDYQRFQKNRRIEQLLREMEGRYGKELTEDTLSLVSAAGDVSREEKRECRLMEGQHEEQ